MIAALWSNMNYDDNKGTRQRAVEELENNFNEVISHINGTARPEAEIPEDNPFFKPAVEKMKQLERPRNDEGRVRDVIEYQTDQS